MEEATGTQLGEAWDEIELHDKLKIVDDIVTIEQKFLSLSFTRSVSPNLCDYAGIVDRTTVMEIFTSRMTPSQAAKKLKLLVRYHNR